MNKYLNIIVTAACCFSMGVLTSCADSDETIVTPQQHEGQDLLAINLSAGDGTIQTVQTTRTEHGNSSEYQIDKLYIHLFDTDTGQEVDLSGYLSSPYFSVMDGGLYPTDQIDYRENVYFYLPQGMLSHTGHYKLFVSANYDYNNIPYYYYMLGGDFLPCYMSGQADLSYNSSFGSYYSANIELVRGIAKLRVHIDIDKSNQEMQDMEIASNYIALLNMANNINPFNNDVSYSLDLNDFERFHLYVSNDAKIDNYNPKTYPNENDAFVLYTYETLSKYALPVSPIDSGLSGDVQLFLDLRLTNGSNPDPFSITKTIPLIDKWENQPLEFKRNTIYDIYVSIKSLTQVYVYTDILEWKDTLVNGDIKGTYLTASNIEMDQKGTLPLEYLTDGDTVYVDWSQMPAEVKRSGTAVADSSDITYFVGGNSVPLQWVAADGADKSYMGFVRPLTLSVGNIVRKVEISYIPTLTVDCHVIDMPLYSYVEGGSQENNFSYYISSTTQVLDSVKIVNADQTTWLHLSESQVYAAAPLSATLDHKVAYLHCDENPYYGADRYAMIEYKLPTDTFTYRLRIKQVIPVFVGYWSNAPMSETKSGAATRAGIVTPNYTHALYAEQIEELSQGLTPYSKKSAVVYTDRWDGQYDTFAAYEPAHYNNYQDATYSVLNYCASKNRAAADGSIATADRHWFTPAQYQLAGMLCMMQGYDNYMVQPLVSMPVWHYASTDCQTSGAYGVAFAINCIGGIFYGKDDENMARCVRAVNITGQTAEITTQSIGNAEYATYIDVRNMPGNYYTTRTLNLSAGAKLGNVASEQNTIYRKLRISRYYATTTTGHSATAINMNWAVAVGLPTSYNSVAASTATQAVMVQTGCNGYWEQDASEIGSWRLPTAHEAALMAIYADRLGLNSGEYAWTQTDQKGSSTNKATYVQFKGSSMNLYLHNDYNSYGTKSTARAARCVREIN